MACVKQQQLDPSMIKAAYICPSTLIKPMKHLLLMLAIACTFSAYSQADSGTVYYHGYMPTTKDSADSYIVFVKEGELWHGKKYDLPAGTLVSEGTYRKGELGKRVGSYKQYNDAGNIKSTAMYNDTSLLLERVYFYKSGKKQSSITFDGVKDHINKCWDEAGNEVTPCVIEKEAKFPGGLQGWVRFLERTLNANVAADAGAPAGVYTVRVQFLVDKEGNVSQPALTAVPPWCMPCGDEVLRVFAKTPRWEPATINGEPVLYQAIQHISFQVIEEEVKPRKRRRGE